MSSTSVDKIGHPIKVSGMFASHLRRVYFACDKVIIRGLRSRRLFPKTAPNPGLDKRIQAFQKDGYDIKAEDAEEILEKSESEFYNVGEFYQEHVKEKNISKDELRHHLVKDKYFKDNTPNLLTWSEKEQIRHLATTEPDEWTPEKIAESFPVTVPVVRKLLKYPWKPASVARIARHDESAMRNWTKLQNGNLDIAENLRKQFLKFSNRTIPPLGATSVKVDITQDEVLGEFESIVRRCAASEKTKESTNDKEHLAIEANTPVNTKHKKDHKFVTLDELATKIKKRIGRGNEVDMNDKIMLDTMQSTRNEILSQDNAEAINMISAVKENSLMEHEGEKEDLKAVMNYPERIRIPKKAYKKGATYKVNDCYYDHDGKFLYRVLGMTN